MTKSTKSNKVSISKMTTTGRPSSYTAKIAEKICDLIAVAWTIRQICALDDMPSHDTIYVWLKKYDKFAEQYAKARQRQASYFADEMLEICDDSRNDFVDREGKDGKVESVVDRDHITRDRLRIDTRKWLASKYLPKVYGDTTKHEHTGKDGDVLRIVIEDVAAGDAKDGDNVD